MALLRLVPMGGPPTRRARGMRGAAPPVLLLLAVAVAPLFLGAMRPFALPAPCLQVATQGADGARQQAVTSEDIVSARLRLARGSNLYALRTEGDLDELVKKTAEEGRILIVDYYAPWCRACQRLLHQIHKIAAQDEFRDVVFASVDFELAREFCRKKGVDKLPTLEMYRGEELKQNWAGASKSRMLDMLEHERAEAEGRAPEGSTPKEEAASQVPVEPAILR